MEEVEFIYNSDKTIIQCKAEENMKDIFQRFLIKVEENHENIYFLYNGQVLTEESSFNEVANEVDKDRHKMIILVNNRKEPQDKKLKLSKYIICPECKENIHIKINNFKIYLYDYKNGHKFDNIQLKDFEKTQYIDESKIKCGNDNCQNSKKESFQNKFYICFSCNINLCPLCK